MDQVRKATVEERLRAIAIEVGIDPDQAMQGTFTDLARAASVIRSARESERQMKAVQARFSAKVGGKRTA